MWMTIDLNSEIPIYSQIRNQIIEGIVTGSVRTNDSLPSVRQFAADLGINLHTVNKAYNLLKQEGFVQVHRQKGAVVNPPDSYRANDEYYTNVNEALRPIIAESLCRGVAREDFLNICERIYEEYGNVKEGDNNG